MHDNSHDSSPNRLSSSGHSMAKLLFRMRDVPDDEAEEVRELLTQNKITFFETFAGNWGISMPGLWLVNEQQFDEARALLDEYQEARSTRVKSQYQAKRTRRDQNVLGKLPRRTGAIQRISWPCSTRALLVTEVLCVILRRQKHQTTQFPLRQTLLEIQRNSSRAPQKEPRG